MKRVALVAVLLLAMAGSPARAASPEARGSGLGGAFVSLARGAEGLWWNPGVLGTPLLASAVGGYTLEGGNNALKLTRFRGIVLDDAGERAKAVTDIRKAGEWDARIESLGGGGVTVKGMSLGWFPHVVVSAQDVTPDMAEYALTRALPVTVGQAYRLAGDFTEATYSEYVAGYAHALPKLVPGVMFNAGATLKYFQGVSYEHEKVDVAFTAGPGPAPTGLNLRESATTGSGFGLDLGVMATIFSIVKAGFVAKNIGTALTWSDATVESRTFNPANGSTTSVTTKGDVKQGFPQVYGIGASVTIPVVGTSAGASLDVRSKPRETRAHLGVEQSIGGIIAFRAGMATAGGPNPLMYTAGFGVGFLVAHADLAAGISPGGKGGMVSLSANVNF